MLFDKSDKITFMYPEVPKIQHLWNFIFFPAFVHSVTAQDMLLTHANVLIMDSREILSDAQVLIQDGKIIAINMAGTNLNIPAGTIAN